MPYYENIVAVSDYNHGILLMNITCLNVSYCHYLPLSIFKYSNLGDIAILAPDNYYNEKLIFAQILSPPQVLEISLDNLLKPTLARIYDIKGDEHEYVSIDIVDANVEYVVTHLFSTKLMKPIFRLFKRDSTYFTLGHAQFEYLDFAD